MKMGAFQQHAMQPALHASSHFVYLAGWWRIVPSSGFIAALGTNTFDKYSLSEHYPYEQNQILHELALIECNS